MFLCFFPSFELARERVADLSVKGSGSATEGGTNPLLFCCNGYLICYPFIKSGPVALDGLLPLSSSSLMNSLASSGVSSRPSRTSSAIGRVFVTLVANLLCSQVMLAP